MANKTKNRQKQVQKKAQKQKNRQAKIKAQILSEQTAAQPGVEDIVDYAIDLVEKGDLAEGKKVLDKLKKKHGNNAQVHYGLGAVAGSTGDFETAIECFGKAAKIEPDFVEAHYNLGVSYQKLLKVGDMIVAYQQVVKLGEPDSEIVTKAQQMLAVIAEQARKDDGISLDEFVAGYRLFEQGVKHLALEEWEKAISKFNETLQITPRHTQSYGNLGICYSRIGLIKQALEAFDKAIELDPNYEPALLNRQVVATLKEGECVTNTGAIIDYYKDYPMEGKSYVETLVDQQGLLPEQAPIEHER